LENDGRSVDARTGRNPRSFEKFRAEAAKLPIDAKIGLAALQPRIVQGTLLTVHQGRADRRHHSCSGQAQIDDFDGITGKTVSVLRAMFFVKVRPDPLQRCRVDWTARDRNLEFVALADVTQVQTSRQANALRRYSILLQPPACFAL